MSLKQVLQYCGLLESTYETRGKRARRQAKQVLLPVAALLFLSLWAAPQHQLLTGFMAGPGKGGKKAVATSPFGKDTFQVAGAGLYGKDYMPDLWDPERHLRLAERFHYETLQASQRIPSQEVVQQRNVRPTLEQTLSPETGDLKFERRTSYIHPRPVIVREKRDSDAIILVDVSGSMKGNATTLLQGEQWWKGNNLASVAALVIARHYIVEKKATVAGAIFNNLTYTSTFTDDLDSLAGFFSRVPDGGTTFRPETIRHLAQDVPRKNPHHALDIYILSDLGFSNIHSVIQEALTMVNFGRIYVLEFDAENVRARLRRYSSEKDSNLATKVFGRTAYRTTIRSENDLKHFYQRFRQDVK